MISKRTIIFKTICLLLTVITLSNPALGHAFELVAQENLKSLIFDNSSGYYSSDDVIDKEYYELLPQELNKQLNPSPYIQRNNAFKFLTNFGSVATHNILDQTSWQDLELLCGTKSDPSHYLAHKLNRASTELGRILLSTKIVNPTTDVATIKEQQLFVQTMLAHKNVMNQINTRLGTCCLLENALLSLWGDGLFYGLFLKELNVFSFSKKLNVTLGVNPLVLEANEKMLYIENLSMVTISILAALGAFLYAGLTIAQSIHTSNIEYWNKKTQVAVPLMPKLLCEGIKYISGDTHTTDFTSQTIINLAIACITTVGALEWFAYSKNNILSLNTYGNCIQTKLIHIARYFNNIRFIVNVCDKNPELNKFNVVKSLKDNLNNVEKSSTHIKKLFELLSTNTFKGTASVFSNRGRIYAAYKLIQLFKADLANLMLAMAEFDAQFSIVRLYDELEAQGLPVCYAEFIESDSPSFYMQELWNPMLDQTAITNDCVCGSMFNKRKNMIITGPNAGGKTTLLRSMVLNAILAQSLGICTARRCILTPFSKIITYLNITDDIAAGNSHFKAGVLRARELINTVSSVKDREFTLCAVDEAFNGTSFKEGQAAAYALINILGSYMHNICLTCTHFPLISRLEQETNFFTNYKVTVQENLNGTITYPFKLEPGISGQIITLKILEQEGFGDQFLTQAQEALAMS